MSQQPHDTNSQSLEKNGGAAIGFDGTGTYLPPQTDQGDLSADAIDLAGWLDNYNNGMYCGG